MDTAKKNLICILILLTISTVISIRTDKMTKVQTDLYQSGENCNKTNAWSSDIANGRVAPWTYAGGQEVTNNGNLFRAMWGGTEVPGANLCRTEAECRNNGWQWMLVGQCRVYNQYANCNDKNAWSSDIANGRVAPWTYLGGNEVTENGNLYKAMWGGTEVPGANTCRTEAECRHNGWQWMLVGECKASYQNVSCHEKNAWSSDIANGRVAPWTYAGGQEVTNNGNLFRAMWGGTEVPGEKICSTEADCRNKGWQWMIVGTCSQEEPVNSICNGKNEWSVDIANGRKAPWTYLGGAQVTHNGALYKAMWGGSEVPGTHVCRTDGECRNNGWQWMTEGQC